jgi:formate dehydrogenase major subunit
MIREHKGDPLKRVSWDTALNFVVDKLNAVKEKYGPDAIMTTGSSRGTGNESNLAMQRFARACLGTNNIDNCART